MIKSLNTPIVVPEAVRRKAGLRRGDQIEFKDARLAKAEEEIKAGHVHGPFTAKEASGFVERLAKERAAKKTTRSRR